ncbi:MAG: glutamate 5-kinase [Erysipelotrichaceae bacterium]|nr:glutamate 5-kinase [Erysipelotrichaceae bacterium]
MRDFSHVKSVIIKVGSSSLCDEKGNIDTERILRFIEQIAMIRRKGIQVTLVSSGAIRAGQKAMNLKKKPNTIPQKQALAAIGQASLMRIYDQLFNLFHIKSAQVLMNHDDFDHRKRLLNFTNTMQALMEYDVLPIINENDTLAVEEIKVGDNDTIASLVVPIVNADLVILVSDIDGLYDSNPNQNPEARLIAEVQEVTPEIEAMAGDTSSSMGTGGMITKLRAAKVCNEYGCDMAIVNGEVKNSLVDFIEGKQIGTLFNGRVGRNLNSRQHWIMYQTWAKGSIKVDDGCKRALRRHKSLLPSGIISVSGDFTMSAVVDIVDKEGQKIAKGITNYSTEEISRIQGLKSDEIEGVLGYKDYDEVIHANNMVLVKG